MKELNNLLSYLNGLLLEKEIILSPATFQILYKLITKFKDPIARELYDLATGNPKEEQSHSFIDVDLVSGKEAGIVSFLPVNREEGLSNEEKWTSTKRMDIKIGKLVTTIYAKNGLELMVSELQEFINRFKAEVASSKGTFKIVQGNEIREWYLEDCYIKGKGSLQNSCMRYTKCQSYFDVYCYNDNVELLIYVNDNNELLGRSIIWKKVYCSDDDNKVLTVMDRIYSTEDFMENIFIQFAKEKGWYYKEKQTVLMKKITNGSDVIDCSETNLYVILPEKTDWSDREEEKPYMDTFVNLATDKDEPKYTLNTKVVDGHIEEWIFVNGIVGMVVCGDCLGEGETECEHCNGGGEVGCNNCDRGKLTCNDCGGSGEITCICRGKSKIKCEECDGEGKFECMYCFGENSECEHCNGTNTEECFGCGGSGNLECKECNNGSMKCPTCTGSGSVGQCEECSDGWVACNNCEAPGLVVCQRCEGEGFTYDN